MKYFWKLSEMAMDAAVPFVAIWFIYGVFIRPELPDSSVLMFATVYLVFSFSRTNHQAIGGVGRKPEEYPYQGR